MHTPCICHAYTVPYEQVVAEWSAAVLRLIGCAVGELALCGPDASGNAATANDTFGF